MNMGNGGSKQLFIFSIHKEDFGLKINKDYLKSSTDFTFGLKWSPDGRFLSGLASGMKKKAAVLDYQQDIIRKYKLPFSGHYCWTDDQTLLNCSDNKIIRSLLKGIANSEQIVLHEGKREACIGGAIKDKPVYAVDKDIYWGKKLLFTATEDVEELFLGQTQVVFACDNTVGVIDLNGKEIFRKAIIDDSSLLAFSERRGAIYILTNNRSGIECCDINDKGMRSTLVSIDQIRKKLRVENRMGTRLRLKSYDAAGQPILPITALLH